MISIIMGTYNGGKYLKEQINSILNQDFCNWKLFIFDDGSTDNTEEISLKFAQENPDRVFYNKNLIKYGAAGNFFNGIRRVALELAPESKYFCFSDQDDVWVKDKLSRSLAEMQKIEDSSIPTLVYSDVAVTDKTLKVLNNSYFKYLKINPKKIELNYLLMENKLIGGTIMLNKKIIELELEAEKRGLNFKNKAKMHDWWFGLIASSFGKIGRVAGITEYYRQHESNVIGGESFFAYTISRLSRVSEIKKRIYENIEQAEEFLRYFSKDLPEDKSLLLKEFVSIKEVDFFKKRVIVLKNNFFKTGFLRNLALILFL